MHRNRLDGLVVYKGASVDLYGAKTAIHANKRHGIRAYDKGQVNIYLDSQHNTTHDNGGENRRQVAEYNWQTNGTIANVAEAEEY